MANVPTSYPLPRKHHQNEGFLVFSGGLMGTSATSGLMLVKLNLRLNILLNNFFIVILVFLQKVNFYGSKISKYWQQITNV